MSNWTDRDDAELRKWMAGETVEQMQPLPMRRLMADARAAPEGEQVQLSLEDFTAILEANGGLGAENGELHNKLRAALVSAREGWHVAACSWLGAMALTVAVLVARWGR